MPETPPVSSSPVPMSRTWVRVAVGALIFLAIAALLVLFGHVVGTPNQHNPAVYGTVQVRLGPGWSPSERARMTPELARLNPLGPLFEWAPENTAPLPIGTAPTNPHLRTAAVYRGSWGPEGCGSHGAGYYDTNTRVIWIDPVCTPGEALAATLAHELGHFLGMGHVCRTAGEEGAFQCSPVGFDRASIMNPTLGADGITGSAEDPNAPPPLDPSFKDLDEFRRARQLERLHDD